MSPRPPRSTERIDRHQDGTVRARGPTRHGVPVGYWEWFRKDGTRLRSGHFDEHGRPVGEWITYDARGRVYKVTRRGPAPGQRPAPIGQRAAG
jgi:hypothetical protein